MAKDFSAAIDEIMPLVSEKDTSAPFIISRDSAYHDWIVCYPYPAGNAESFLKSQREHDPLAAMFTGADFSRGSFAEVYDRVLYVRLRDEYYVARSSGKDTDEIHAMTCFIQDNIGAFSHTVTNYLTTLDRPLASLMEMCPFSLATDKDEWSYNEDLTAEAVRLIEQRVTDITEREDETYLNKQTKREVEAVIEFDEFADERREIDGYEETQSVLLANHLVILAENHAADEPHMVCYCKLDTDVYYNKCTTADYIEALSLYAAGIQSFVQIAENERDGNKSMKLTAAHCLPDSKDTDYTGKLVIVDAKVLKQKYRASASQLIQCTHGNGARPNAIGRSVFGTELYSGVQTAFDRSAILGVADESKLPKWAADKLGIKELTSKATLKEYGEAIDTAIRAGAEHKSVPHTLEVLDTQYGRDKTNKLLATVVLTSLKDDGRISDSHREWAKNILTNTDNLKTINVKSHPAHFDNLMMYAIQRMAEPEKSRESKPIQSAKPKTKASLHDNLERNKARASQNEAARQDKPAISRGDKEV